MNLTPTALTPSLSLLSKQRQQTLLPKLRLTQRQQT